MKKLNQAGSHLVIIMLMVVLLGVAGFAAWRVLGKDKTTDTTTDSSQSSETASDETVKVELTKTYKNESAKFTVSYPDNWTETTKKDNSDPEYPAVDSELKSPDGAVVHLKTDMGGFGGICGEEGADPCPTKEYLFKEAIKETAYDDEKRDGKTKTPIYLIRSRTTGADSKTVYTVGLETDKDNELKLNAPKTELLFSFSFFSQVDKTGKFKGVIYAYSYCDTPDNFGTSSDCGTAEEILRSFSFYE